MKTCTKCKQNLEDIDFCKDKSNKSGLTSWCKTCRNDHNKGWRANNPDKIKVLNERHTQTRKEYYSKPDIKLKYRKASIKKQFGIEYDVYEFLDEKQGGVCAICKTDEKSVRNKHLCIDHDHSTGKIRGLLCSNCNRGLGLLKDSEEILKSAIQYLLSNYSTQEKEIP
jgi:cytochrome b involved in lipid metabolism